MSKRIITKFKKLNPTIKKAIYAQFPDGVEDQLVEMKHLIKGYLFDGFVFEHDGDTYLIEWDMKGTIPIPIKLDVEIESDENFEEPDLESE